MDRVTAVNLMARIVPVVVCALVAASCSGPQVPVPVGPDPSNKPALFYAKDGSLYVSDPAGSPGRKLTDGPADTDPGRVRTQGIPCR